MQTKKIQIIDSILKDADTVDGKHADEFATSEHTHSYSEIEGALTVTDAVTENDTMPVTSGAVYSELKSIVDALATI